MRVRSVMFCAVLGSALSVAAVARAAAVCDSNLLIVLDRSCSMDQPPNAMETRTKWEIAVEALTTLTTDYAGQINFGLIMFPDTTGVACDQDGPIYVPMGPGNEAAVVAALTDVANFPDGPCVTNIDTGMAQVPTDPAYQMPDKSGRRGFVLLLSDGKQSGSCGGSARDSTTAATITTLYDAGYPTYVVGFGGAVDPDSLNLFAQAGGVPRMGAPMYYQADTAMDLNAAIDAIAGAVATDPEFPECQGTPCPDGRCFGAYETCVDGLCLFMGPDAGPTPDAAASGGDGGAGAGDGGAGGSDDSGCGCRAGRRAQGSLAGLVLFVVAALAARPWRREGQD